MKVTLESDHQFNKLGSRYLNNGRVDLTLSDECAGEFISLKLEGIDGEFFVQRYDLFKALKVLNL